MSQPEATLKPNVTKSFLKGTLGIAVLSIFLNINPSTYVDYAIFLGLSYSIRHGGVIRGSSNLYRAKLRPA